MFILLYVVGLEIERITFSLSRVTVSTAIFGNKQRNITIIMEWYGAQMNYRIHITQTTNHTTVSPVQYVH